MRRLLRRIILVSGVGIIVIPIVIGLLWFVYLKSASAEEAVSLAKCVPEQFQVNQSDTIQTVVSWKTAELCEGYVILGKEPATLVSSPYKVLPNEGVGPATDHTVILTKADELQRSYMAIVSDGEWYGIEDALVRLTTSR